MQDQCPKLNESELGTRAAGSAAARTGAELIRARERLGVSLGDASAALRIRPAYLEALEKGRLGDLPGTAYALAFLRSYSEALGLDPDAMAARFKTEAASLARPPDLEFPAPPPERGLPAGAVALLAVVLAVGAYAGWYRLSGEGRLPPETIAPVPAQLAPLAEQTPRPAAVPGPASPSVVARAAPPAPPDSNTPTMAYAAEPPSTPPSPAVSPASASAAVAMVVKPPAGSLPSGPGVARLVVQTSADAWLQVRKRGGAVVFSRLLHAGDTWPVPAEPDLILTTGNAGGTELVIDGTATAPLGPSGAVRRDVPLDPDALKAGGIVPLAGVAAAR